MAQGRPAMTRPLFCFVCLLALVTASGPARSSEHAAARSAEGDCESGMQKLDESQAEGEDRLREKYQVIEACASQYKRDRTIGKLVKECAKYLEQAVVKQQQFVAECQLAAFHYANALRALKAEYGK
jgi:hypothetical protein